MIDLRRKWDALPQDDVRRLQVMREMGYTAGEIAEITGASKRSVDSRLSRFQKTKP
jgi:DNA-directed RNA polymerase specialized sigma24 family protein